MTAIATAAMLASTAHGAKLWGRGSSTTGYNLLKYNAQIYMINRQ